MQEPRPHLGMPSVSRPTRVSEVQGAVAVALGPAVGGALVAVGRDPDGRLGLDQGREGVRAHLPQDIHVPAVELVEQGVKWQAGGGIVSPDL
ncbi:MAG: hypothetical protein M0Z47_05060 [Actinomycetota bacterium]|nr:hypothetical protein [Actinomycetota bacterium]